MELYTVRQVSSAYGISARMYEQIGLLKSKRKEAYADIHLKLDFLNCKTTLAVMMHFPFQKIKKLRRRYQWKN